MIPYSGKFLRVQTFAKMPPEAPKEIFSVFSFYFCNKALHSAVPSGPLKFLAVFYFCGSWLIRENRKSLHHVKRDVVCCVYECMHVDPQVLPSRSTQMAQTLIHLQT